jgi:predicted enzyme related to lactoylglutathione lyase
MSSHAVVHIEIPARSPEAASKFYAELFGWKVTGIPQFDYFTFEAKPGPGGGFPGLGENSKVGELLVYVDTDDIPASLARAESLGGKTLLPKSAIPGIGWYAFFADPTGNRVGLYIHDAAAA